jgi:hypothetical protein
LVASDTNHGKHFKYKIIREHKRFDIRKSAKHKSVNNSKPALSRIKSIETSKFNKNAC